jgi:hypothetical protein
LVNYGCPYCILLCGLSNKHQYTSLYKPLSLYNRPSIGLKFSRHFVPPVTPH